MNLIRYILDFFHINGGGVQSVKYAKGQAYPATDETMSHVDAGIAEVVPNSDPQSGRQGDAHEGMPGAELQPEVAVPVPSSPVAPLQLALSDSPPAATTTAVRDVDLADVVQGVQFTPDYVLERIQPADSTIPQASSAQRPDDPAETSPQEAAITQS